MKRAWIICLAALLLASCLVTGASAAGSAAYAPDLLTAAYNDSIGSVFSALSFDDSTIATVKQYARVEYFTQKDANSSQTIFFFFAASGRYSRPDNVMFYTSLSDSNPLKNIPQFAFAFAVCTVDPSCDFSEFLTWVNDATDGSMYTAASFLAMYTLEPKDNSSILLQFR